MKDELILVGIITGAHGLKGEVHIKALTSRPEKVVTYGTFTLKNGRTLTPLGLRGIRAVSVIARLEGISDRDQAEMLRGQELYITRAQLPNTEEDEFYHQDLIDLDVVTEEGAELGKIMAVQNYGASDILEIQKPHQPSVMVPFIEDAIISVDLDKSRVVIRSAFVVS